MVDLLLGRGITDLIREVPFFVSIVWVVYLGRKTFPCFVIIMFY